MSDEPVEEPQRFSQPGGFVGCLLIVLGSAGLFATLGTFVGIFICCYRWPDSNLAGLVGIFYGFPIGLAVGVLAGLAFQFWRTS